MDQATLHDTTLRAVALAEAALQASADYSITLHAMPDTSAAPDPARDAQLDDAAARHHAACVELAGVRATTLAGWRAKARVLDAEVVFYRDGSAVLQDNVGLAWSLLQDILNADRAPAWYKAAAARASVTA